MPVHPGAPPGERVEELADLLLDSAEEGGRAEAQSTERAPKLQRTDAGPVLALPAEATPTGPPVHTLPLQTQDMTSMYASLNAQFAAIMSMSEAMKAMADNMARLQQTTAPAQPQSEAPTRSASSSAAHGTGISDEDLARVIHPAVVVQDKLNPAFQKHIVKTARALNDTIDKFFKYQVRIESLENDIKHMEASEKHSYPTGTRPFRTPMSDVELDAPLQLAIDCAATVIIPVPQGATRREAMTAIHHAATIEIKKIQLEAAKSHIEEIRPTITRQHYWQNINSWKADEVDELGLQKGIQELPNKDLAIKKAEEAYTNIVTKLQARKAREKAEKEARDAEKRKADEELLKNGPADALRELISVGVKAELKKSNQKSDDMEVDGAGGNVDDDPIEEFDPSPEGVRRAAEKAAEELTARKQTHKPQPQQRQHHPQKQPLTKNGESPESAPGQNYGGHKSKGKGKGGRPSRSLTTWAAAQKPPRSPETWAERMRTWEAPKSAAWRGGGKPQKGGGRGA